MNLTRRSTLKRGAGALAVGGLAGCLDDVDASREEFDSAYAAFFALWDWSQAVAGDEAEIENPVEFGQLGHGWEPDGDLPREIASTDAFVYLDTPEFSWAQDVAATLEADYDTVAAIDGLAGLESQMLESGHDHGHDEAHHNETEQEGEEAHHEGEENGRRQLDPHIWVDPVFAQEMAINICHGFIDIDPENEETYRTNTQNYNEQLADLDAQFEAIVEEANQTTAVLAGHSSFGYLENRYGFDIHTVTGISPDAEPDSAAIAETVEFVNNNGVDVILYDRFESDRLAEAIVENSSATETMALTAAAGTTAEWADSGWGFIEQMEQVTIPAFRRALGAE